VWVGPSSRRPRVPAAGYKAPSETASVLTGSVDDGFQASSAAVCRSTAATFLRATPEICENLPPRYRRRPSVAKAATCQSLVSDHGNSAPVLVKKAITSGSVGVMAGRRPPATTITSPSFR
jgi:hypothetical protein